MAWWNDPRLDNEGTYDYLVEELPENSSKWHWYLDKCDDCGKQRRLHRTDTGYFYCWDGWDSMSYNTCWLCHLKDIVRSSISKTKKKMQKLSMRYDIKARVVFCRFCKQNKIPKEHRSHLWKNYYSLWSDKSMEKYLRKGVE